MTTHDEVNEFLKQGGAPSFKFENMGDTVSGEVVSMEVRQQTSIDDGKPEFWDDGNPKKMLVIILQTDMRVGEDDDGRRSLYARKGAHQVAKGKGGAMVPVILDAVRKAGKTDIEEGGRLTVQWSGEAVPKGRFNPAKLYSATYQPPTRSISAEDLL